MGPEVELMRSMSASLAEHKGIGQSGRARRYMHRGSTSEIDAAQSGDPASGIPSPTSDGIVDDGRPDKHEDHAREHPTSFGDSTHGKSNARLMISHAIPQQQFGRLVLRDGSEHSLVDGKEQVWYSAATDRRLRQDVTEANVGQVSDESPGGVGEGQRISPEEPLKRSNTDGHHRQPD